MATASMIKNLVEAVKDQASLLTLLTEGLDWDVHPEFALGDAPEIASGVNGTPCTVSEIVGDLGTWKVFLVEFKDDYHRKDLRELLASVRRHDRLTASIQTDDLIFIVAAPGYKEVRFVLFEQRGGGQPKIRSFGWEIGKPTRTVINVNLPALRAQESANWVEAWSTLAATNEFFKTYETFFNRWCPEISVKTGDGRSLTRDELKDIQTHLMQRTMNRLLFITFLSKKGWLELEGPETRSNYLTELYGRWKHDSTGERFYEGRLGKLFFEALAKEDDRVRELLKPLIGRVPYLNGGLFERKHFERPEEGEDLAVFPDGMFEELLTPGGLLNAYNFTVVESYDETDQDIAVDPEMLGRIFEKLVLDRRDEGKYYTPRIVVRFMCRESLKRVLGDGFDAIIDAPNLEAKKVEAAKLDGAALRSALTVLKDIKVVDPACGSGAYLLGMLHELFDLVLAVELRLDERTEAQRYGLKLEIIEKNLYGVDMDDFATNIAMLRLWLSLVVDRTENPLDQPGVDASLPNLRFKICVGDSLSAPNPRAVSMMATDAYFTHAHRLGELHDEYFLPDRHRIRPKEECLAEIEMELENISDVLSENPAPPGAFDWRRDFAEVFAPKVRTGDYRGFDIVLANPPYGVKVDDSVRYAYFDRRTEGAQSKDSYGIFMARALQLLRPGGTMCFIVSDTWRTIKSHLPLRRRLLTKTVHHFIDLPSWIFDATVNTGVLTVTNAPPPGGHKVIAADLRPIPNNDWRMLEANLTAIAHYGPDLQTLTFARYTYPQAEIANYENCSFYIASSRLYRMMSDPRFQKLGDIADVKQGLATADNEYYLRKRPGVRGTYQILDEAKLLTDAEIAALSDDEKRNGVDPTKYCGRHFVPYDKGGESDAEGGWMPNYRVPTGYFIDWSQAAVHRLRTATIADVKRSHGRSNEVTSVDEERIASRVQNEAFYFREGITFSPTGVYAPTFRRMSPGPFDKEGSGIFSDTLPLRYGLGLLCSRLTKYLNKCYVNGTVHAMQGDVAETPIPPVTGEAQALIEDRVEIILANQSSDPRYPYHLREQREIDALVYQLYGLDEDDIREVTLWYCRRYRTLAEAQGVLAEAQEKYADHLAWCDFILSKSPGYWSSHPLLMLIAQGEGHHLELKSTYVWDVRENRENKELRHEVFKTIAAFRNTDGGDLLIGVEDSGNIFGLAKDGFTAMRAADEFERKVRDGFVSVLDPVPLGKEVTFEFSEMLEGIIAKVHVNPKPGVQYVQWPDKNGHKKDEVWIREGNRSRKLEGRERDLWIASRLGP